MPRKKLKKPCPRCGAVDLADQYEKKGLRIEIKCECGYQTHHFTDETQTVHQQLKGAKPDPVEVKRQSHNVGERGPSDSELVEPVGGDSD